MKRKNKTLDLPSGKSLRVTSLFDINHTGNRGICRRDIVRHKEIVGVTKL